MGELAQKIRAKYPGVYDSLPDGELEQKVIAKYPGVYDHLAGPPNEGGALAETPFVTAGGAKVKTDNPQYRAAMEQFIRTQAPRDLKQEAVRGLPMGNRLADLSMGAYNDPVHPGRTVDAVLGPQTQSTTTGGAMVQGVGNFMRNPGPQIEGLIAAPADLATGLYNATTSPESGSLAKFGKDTVKGIAAPTGLADLAAGDMQFPEARAAWEQNALGSGLMAYGAAKGAVGAKQGLSDLGRATLDKVGITPEKLYASSLKQSTAIPMEQRAANVQAGLEGGYVPNKKGLGKLYDDINGLNDQISSAIDEASVKGKAANTVPLEAELSKIDASITSAKQATNQTAVDRAIMEHMIRNEGTQWMQKNNVSDSMYKANLRKAYDELPPERQIQGGSPSSDSVSSPVVENLLTRKKQIQDAIDNAGETGKTVKVDDILKRLEDVKQRAIDSFGDNGPALKSIRGFERSLKNHPSVVNGEMPIALAQQMKVNTYKQLKNAYGELKGFEVEAKKAMARGAKEEIVAQIPELADLNAKDSTLINLEKVLFKAVNRIENRDMVGIGVPVKLAAGAMHGGAGAIAGLLAGLIDTPAIKANLAIALHKARGKAVPASEVNTYIQGIKASLAATNPQGN